MWRIERAKNGGIEGGSKIAVRFKLVARSEIVRLEGRKRIYRVARVWWK